MIIFIHSFTYSSISFPGMVHAGLGSYQMDTLLSTINIPSMHHKTMKRREREVSGGVSQVASESCSAALQEEAEATRSSEK